MPPTRTVISGASKGQQVCAVHQQVLGRRLLPRPEVVPEPICERLQNREGLHVGLLLRRIRSPGGKRYRHLVPGVLSRSFNGGAAAQDDQVGQRDLFPAGL